MYENVQRPVRAVFTPRRRARGFEFAKTGLMPLDLSMVGLRNMDAILLVLLPAGKRAGPGRHIGRRRI